MKRNQRLTPATLRSFLGVSLLLVSCGKKAETSKKRTERREDNVITDFDRFLNSQEVICEPGQVCPSYISKIVVKTRDSVRFCTGFLVNRKTVATSASCLSNILRLNGQDCSKDVFFFFPKTYSRPAERVGCEKVIQVSQIDGKDPVLWRDDVSFLELKEEVHYRPRREIVRHGFPKGDQFHFWGIEQIDDKTAFIRRQTCEAVHGSYLNPLASHTSSPSMLFANCSFKKGSTGGPIIDSRAKVRGIVSQNIDQKLREYLESTGLLVKPLKDMLHATSFACAPTLENTNVNDEAECMKDLDYASLDRLRSEMLAPGPLFSELKKKLEEKLSDSSRYFNFGVRLHPAGDVQKAEAYPRCFKNVSSWIKTLNTNRNAFSFEINLPKVALKRSMDPFGKIEGKEVADGESGYFMQFSPKSLKNSRESTVFMWNDEMNEVYHNVNETCL